MTPGPSREQLEHDADAARNRLARTLSALDRRGHDAVDVGLQVRRALRPEPLAILAGGLALAIGGIGMVVVHHFSTRTERRQLEGVAALRRVWQHPERVAVRRPHERSVVAEVTRNVLIAAGTYAASALFKYALRRMTR